jgi:hypothetical protein
VLSYDLASGAWARERLRELERDPEMARDPRVQDLRRRMLRRDDVLAVWQRADQPSADVERLLLDQLEQDPANRLAFEFLMGHYLLACDLQGVARLAPRIIDMTGPAYIGPDGRRRTPRLYQEAMSLYALTTGQKPEIEGFEIQPETLRRMEAFRQVMVRSAVKEIAVEAARGEFRNTYFFYFTFGAGGYQ